MKQGQRDFLQKNGIINLAPGVERGHPLVLEQLVEFLPQIQPIPSDITAAVLAGFPLLSAALRARIAVSVRYASIRTGYTATEVVALLTRPGNLIYDYQFYENLFQDAAGTISVTTDEQPVRFIKPWLGTNNIVADASYGPAISNLSLGCNFPVTPKTAFYLSTRRTDIRFTVSAFQYTSKTAISVDYPFLFGDTTNSDFHPAASEVGLFSPIWSTVFSGTLWVDNNIVANSARSQSLSLTALSVKPLNPSSIASLGVDRGFIDTYNRSFFGRRRFDLISSETFTNAEINALNLFVMHYSGLAKGTLSPPNIASPSNIYGSLAAPGPIGEQTPDTAVFKSISVLSEATLPSNPVVYSQLVGMVEPQRLDRLIAFVFPGSGTAPTAFGTAPSSSGVSHITPSTANFASSLRDITLSTSATAGVIAYHRQGNTLCVRGNASNIGGFRFTIDTVGVTLVAGMRAFVGLVDTVGNPTNIDPLTATAPGCIGLAVNTNTGNWNIVSHANGSAVSVIALPATFPFTTLDVIQLQVNCAPNTLLVDYKVSNLTTGASQVGTIAAANLPSNTTYLAPLVWCCNNTTAAICAIAFSGWKLERYLSPTQFPVAGTTKRLGCKLRFPAAPSPSIANLFPANSVLQAIPWQLADYNDGGMHDLSAKILKIPEDGLWSCSANLFFTGIGRRYISLFVNNQEFRLQDFTATSGADQLLSGSVSLRLNKNDLVSVGGYANAVSSLLAVNPAPLGANYAIFERLN